MAHAHVIGPISFLYTATRSVFVGGRSLASVFLAFRQSEDLNAAIHMFFVSEERRRFLRGSGVVCAKHSRIHSWLHCSPFRDVYPVVYPFAVRIMTTALKIVNSLF